MSQTLNTKNVTTGLDIASNVTTSNITIGGGLTTGQVRIGKPDSTVPVRILQYANAINTNSGAMVVTGGLGVIKDIHCATLYGEVQVQGALTMTSKGSVTQTGSATSGVFLNSAAGTITTVNQAIASHGSVGFTVTNSFVSADSIILTQAKANGVGAALIEIDSVSSGSFVLKIHNASSVGMSNTIEISFVVL